MDGWDEALQKLVSPAPLLQSWGYGEVQAAEGWRVERVELSGFLATVLLAGPGWLGRAYVPRGPVPATPAAVGELAAWAAARGLASLCVEPEAGPELAGELRRLGFVPAPSVHPRHTLLVPLGDEATLLASFKPKHRYNIRLAARRGVEVVEGAEATELHRLTQATARRQGISLPSEAQYRRRLEKLGWCRTYVARHQGRALAAILVARFAGRAYYLFGGSSDEGRELQPSYAAQWAAMRAAAAAGCRDYDLWGVPPAPDPSHPWHGLWQFKTGFGGRLVEYCGAWELDLSALRSRLGRALGWMARARRRIFT